MDRDETSPSPSSIDKGKGRAHDPTERTPLLTGASSSRLHSTEDVTTETSTSPYRTRALWARLLTVFLVSLLLCVVVLVVFGLLSWSYASRASKLTPDQLLHYGVALQGPDRVDVLQVSRDQEISVEVSGRVGLNAGAIVGVQSDPYEDGAFQDMWKSFGRWWIRRLGRVTVELSTVDILSEDGDTLFSLDIPPIELEVQDEAPRGSSWLQNVTTTVLIRPASDMRLLTEALRKSWQNGVVVARVSVDSVDVKGGSLDEQSWRRKVSHSLSNVQTGLRLELPTIPGLPAPGPENPLPPIEELLDLKSFHIYSDKDQLEIRAEAIVRDPAPMDFNFSAPALAFLVSLPTNHTDPVPIASISTRPFSLTYPNITLSIFGHVLPFAKSASPLLSTFVGRYLSSEPNTVAISTPLLPGIHVDAVFPAPHPKPKLLRNVTIHDMKIKPGNTFLTSGNVVASVVLPPGLDVTLDVHSILPDVLIFDGEVPDNADTKTKPPVPPLPDPLPERAFGRIRPDDYLNATCKAVEHDEKDGSTFLVSAYIEDVPLEVLPGRQDQFSKFVGKVIFGTEGALAGILGTTDVVVNVEGLPGDSSEGLELKGLPFKGAVRIGKKNL